MAKLALALLGFVSAAALGPTRCRGATEPVEPPSTVIGGNARPEPATSPCPTPSPAPRLGPAIATTTLGPEFLPDALVLVGEPSVGHPRQLRPAETSWAGLDPERLRTAIFGSEPVARTSRAGGICLASAPATVDPMAFVHGRIHRVAAVAPRDPAIDTVWTVVLRAEQPPADLMFERRTATWHLDLFDRGHRRIATTSFRTEIPYDATWDALETRLDTDERGLVVHIRFGVDCDGHVDDQRFVVGVDLDLSTSCLHARSVRHSGQV